MVSYFSFPSFHSKNILYRQLAATLLFAIYMSLLHTYAVSLNPKNVHSYPTTLLKLLFSRFLCDHDDDTHGVLLVSPPLDQHH